MSSSVALFDLAKREEIQPLLQHQQVFRQAIVHDDMRRLARPSTSMARAAPQHVAPFKQAKVSKLIFEFDRDGAFDYKDDTKKKF